VGSLLTSSDLGIEDFMVEQDRSPGSRGHQGDVNLRRPRLTFAHESKSDLGRVWFKLEQESAGTQVLVSILPHLLHILEEGGLLAVDELNSLHPTLALAIVQLFQDHANNPRGAQLLFNTHESTLLGNLLSDPPPLRRDQVWLTEKDRDGATHLYPLTDFKPRPTENLQRGYLQGRYGAIPFIGSLDLARKNESDPT
jgi:AAA15 family ATPase/GTPase